MNETMGDPRTWLSLEFWRDVMQRTMVWAIEAIPKVLIVAVLGIVMLKLVNVVTRRVAASAIARVNGDSVDAREHHKRVSTLVGIFRRVALISVWVLLVVLVLMQVGVNVAPIIAGAGILGLAVGFGSQELVKNLISGFFILLENHIRKGDVAVINGTGGVVEHLGLRTVVLRDLAGVVHVFEAGKIDSLSNMTKTWSAAVFDIGIAYKENTDEAARIMSEVAEELRRDPQYASKILEPMEMFGVDSFGDNAVVLKSRIKTTPIDQWTIAREYRRRLKHAFDENGIEIPFPHRTLYWGEASQAFQIANVDRELASGDRKNENGKSSPDQRSEGRPRVP